MKLESVNRSLPRTLPLLDREMVTGIAKEPATGAVGVGPKGLDGDSVANTRDHGGLPSGTKSTSWPRGRA